MPTINQSNQLQEVLIVCALELETQDAFHDCNVAYCGVGKMNATYNLMKALNKWHEQHNRKPKLILNIGTAGSPHYKPGQIINCTSFVQRDVDATALGFPLYETPFDKTAALLTNGERYSNYPEGICGSGDSFVRDQQQGPWSVVDMEAYALAKTCLQENMSFGCLKYITDGADDNAAHTWSHTLKYAATKLRSAVNHTVY